MTKAPRHLTKNDTALRGFLKVESFMKNAISQKPAMLPTIALLRGINVGGNTRIAMADLKQMILDLGLSAPATLLQSGNLVFMSHQTDLVALQQLLEKETVARLGVAADYILRSPQQWRKIIENNPYPTAAIDDPSHLVVVFLKKAPTAEAIKNLKSAIAGRETIEVVGSELYAIYPDGIGRSKFTLTVIEKKLETRGTGRNWNTVLKLGNLAGG